MPVSIPTYKVVRVVTKIGVLIYCHDRNISPSQVQKEVIPLATATAGSLLVGMTTADLPGLIVVAWKVANRVAAILAQREIPVEIGAQWYENVLGRLPDRYGNFTYIAEQGIAINLEPNPGIAHFLLGLLGESFGQGLLIEILKTIAEEFDFTDMWSLLKSMFE